MRNVGRYDDSAKPGTPRYQKAVKEFAQALRLLRYRVKPHAYRRIASRWFRFHAARELYLKSWFFRCPEAHPTLMDRLQALVRRHDKESVRHGATLLAAILRERSSHAAHNPTHITRADITRARRLGISSPIDLANLRRARLRAATVARSPRQRRNWMRDTPGAPPPPAVWDAGDVAAWAAVHGASVYAVATRVLLELHRRLPGWRPASALDFGTGVGCAVWAAQAVFGAAEYRHFFTAPSPVPVLDTRPLGAGLTSIVCVDPSSHFAAAAADVLRGMPVTTRRFLRIDPSGHDDPAPAADASDLVVCAYTLCELESTRARRDAVAQLWRQCRGALVIIEPGTPVGHQLISDARDVVLRSRWRLPAAEAEAAPDVARIVAPCPHHAVCPLSGSATQWCRFRQPVGREPLVREYKRTYEGKALRARVDSPAFSYCVFVRNCVWLRGANHTPAPAATPEEVAEAEATLAAGGGEMRHDETRIVRPWRVMAEGRVADADVVKDMLAFEAGLRAEVGTFARVIAPPEHRGGQSTLTLCTPRGVAVKGTVSKARHGDDLIYRMAGVAERGDLFPYGALAAPLIGERPVGADPVGGPRQRPRS